MIDFLIIVTLLVKKGYYVVEEDQLNFITYGYFFWWAIGYCLLWRVKRIYYFKPDEIELDNESKVKSRLIDAVLTKRILTRKHILKNQKEL